MAADRVFNFSAGPCCFPLEVLEKAASEMTNWNGCGMGVVEMSHRGKEFVSIFNECEANLRDMLNVPADWKVLLLQGGATGQFGAVPLNLLGSADATGDYAVTGQWGDKAEKECKKFGKANRVCDTKPTKYTIIPPVSEWKLTPGAAYLHYTHNETVNGVEFTKCPDVDVPLVGDVSSNFLTKTLDFNKHVAFYAGAQKNAGPAGVCVTMVKADALGKELPICPTVLSWKAFADADSMYNTPPCYSIYLMGLYLKYAKEKGGVAYWDEQAEKKSGALYDAVDTSSGFYTCPIDKSCRSRVNVPFQIKGGDEALEKKFLEEAKKKKLYTLAGHRTVGGIRASLYNGMPVEGVDALVNFMKDFATDNAA
jgi:phosphoserine aminotransferase